MHRIERPQEPNAFRKYCEAYLARHPWPAVKPNPRDDWNAFASVLLSAYDSAHQDRGGETKKLKDSVVEKLAINQRGCCAYCEERLPAKGDVRIEHWHPKSDVTTDHCWMFDWGNLLAVCSGGASNNLKKNENAAKAAQKNGENQGTQLHCDASKGDSQESILNPYTIPLQCLFSLDTGTGELSADDDVCRQAGIDVQLVASTIRVLNLNCLVLKTHRHHLALHYKDEYRKVQREMKGGKRSKGSVRSILAERWFGGGRVLDLFTTRRLLLKGKAESYIKSLEVRT